ERRKTKHIGDLRIILRRNHDRPRAPYRCRRRRHISKANSERRSPGVAWIMAMAEAGSMLDSPLMPCTAVIHWPRDRAPWSLGLNCRVSRPMPALRRTTPTLTLHDRQAQIRLLGSPFL